MSETAAEMPVPVSPHLRDGQQLVAIFGPQAQATVAHGHVRLAVPARTGLVLRAHEAALLSKMSRSHPVDRSSRLPAAGRRMQDRRDMHHASCRTFQPSASANAKIGSFRSP